ncbi:MAG: hypothetical protein E7160_00720 [Firmicutes bacterium]|nr:hypothetical protein [Bacillota bacterium]
MKKKKNKNKLLIVFIVLLVIVSILGIDILFLEKNKIKDEDKTDIVVPVIEEKENYSFSVDLKDIKKAQKVIYKLKITNYRNKTINKKQLEYTLKILNDDNIDIEIYKDNKKISNDYKDKLNNNKKDSEIYEIIIIPKENLKSSTIAVNVES